MTESINDQWQDLHRKTAILNHPQFTRTDVLNITALTSAQLKNTLDRDLVRLDTHHNPGTGRRRFFTGGDILKLVSAHVMSANGFPLGWFYLVADEIERRGINRIIGLSTQPEYGFITYQMANGDWAKIPFWKDMPKPIDEAKLPVAYQVVNVDRIIDETMAKLRAVADDEPIPDFSIPVIEPEPSPYSPENDFFHAWERDTEGRNVRVGLTFDETEEFEHLSTKWLEQRLSHEVENPHEQKRLSEIHDTHERARVKRLGRIMGNHKTD